jgi:tetratricopeptide (TPR) repeat protein
MAAEPERAAAPPRTGALPASAAAVLICLWLAACGFRGAQAAYQQVQAEFRHGNLSQAATNALRQAERWHDRNSPWFWDFRLLAAEALTAQAKYRDVEDLLRGPIPSHLREQCARRYVDRANLNVSRSRDASEDLGQARRLVHGGELDIRIDLIEGNQALNGRRNERAQELYEIALQKAIRSGDHYQAASALNNLAFSSKRLSRYEWSIEFGERAIAEAETVGARRLEALVHGNIGSTYGLLGELDAALKHERLAVEMTGRMGMSSLEMIYTGELGSIYERIPDVDNAVACFRKAYDMARELESKRDETRFAENLATTFIRDKRWAEAAEWNRRAEQLAAFTGETLAYLERNKALIARGTGHPEESARIARAMLHDTKTPQELVWVAHDLLGRIAAETGRRSEAAREFATALRNIDDARSALADSHYKITLLSYLMPFYQDYVDLLAEQKDDAGALRVAESSRARVLTERMGREIRPGESVSLAGLREFARSANSAVLYFWIAPVKSVAWLIQADGVRPFELPPAAEVEALVSGYRKVVEHSVADPLTATDPAVWNRLMAPIAAAIPKGSRVIVIPDGPLHRLNLETLVVPATAGRPAHYWIEDAEIAVAPSIAIAMAKAARQPEGRGLLVIGDPDYRGTGFDPLPGRRGKSAMWRPASATPRRPCIQAPRPPRRHTARPGRTVSP